MVMGKFPQVDIGVWLRHTLISTCGFLPIVIFEMASSQKNSPTEMEHAYRASTIIAGEKILW
jgi:hypothetical protein